MVFFLLYPTYYEKGPMDQSNLEHLQLTCKNCPLRPTTQSGPDSQTDPLRLIIPEEVVMQPRLTIDILVLQSERLVHVLVNPLVLFQTTQGGIFSVPQKIAMDVGHLFRYADLIVVEVVRLLSVFSVFVDVVLIGETAYVPHVPYVKTEDFVRATVCYNLLTEYFLSLIHI